MTFLWPQMLWLLVLVPAARRRVLFTCSGARRRRRSRYASLAMIARSARARRSAAPPRPAGAFSPRSRADDRRRRAAGRRGHAAVAARDDRPGDRRLGQHARGRRRAEPTGRRAGGGARRSSPSSRGHARSASSRSPPPRPSCRRPTHNRDDIVAAIDRFQLQRGTAIGSGIVVSLAAIFPNAGITLESLNRKGDNRVMARGLDDPPPSTDFKPVPPDRTRHLRSSCSPTAAHDRARSARGRENGRRSGHADLHGGNRYTGGRGDGFRGLAHARAPG